MAVDGAKQREALIIAAEQLLNEGGGVAITARRVTARAGLKSQLLYYYFETMDDLVLAVVRRSNARRRQRFEDVLQATDPLRALWEMMCDPSAASLSLDLLAFAGRSEAIRVEILQAAREMRALQAQAVADMLMVRGADSLALPPAGVALIASLLARGLTSEREIGLTDGHADALRIVEMLISGKILPA